MDELVTILARVGVVGAALTGGTVFAFSTFIMAGLKRLSDAEGIRAMQSINKTVYTPWFMGPFFGTALLSVVSVILGILNTQSTWSIAMIVAGSMFALGAFGVTAVGNVPMNTKLDGMNADDPAAGAYWRRYLMVWTRWNHVRVLVSVGSVLLFVESVRLTA